jgi:glycine cleavage system H lipoate-binding protein
VRVEDDIATIGITDFAQEQLGDITYVNSPVSAIRWKPARKWFP